MAKKNVISEPTVPKVREAHSHQEQAARSMGLELTRKHPGAESGR